MRNATLVFVKCGSKFLLINRKKPPFMGMWNMIGGKMEDGETPEDCARREVFEESGIVAESLELFSVFTWNYDEQIGYAYLAELPEDFDTELFPKKTDEGIIDFFEGAWIEDEKNCGVIDDLKIFLRDIRNGEKNDYHLVYEGKTLVRAIKK